MSILCGLLLAVIGLPSAGPRAKDKTSPPIIYTGMSDASAAVSIGSNLFAVADDETNPIRIYRRDRSGPPVQTLDLSAFLDLDPTSPEADLEAAARIGDRVYWLGSHGRNKNGKDRPNRHCFFATTVKLTPRGVELVPVGSPYKNLLSDLMNAPQLERFHLSRAARKMAKAPGALNIEGLSATPDNHLLLGFRNPIPKGRALVVPLNNPGDVIMKGSPAQLGEPILLDLDGLGIRDIVWWSGTYVILAGPFDYSERFRLYFWSGDNAKPEHIKHVTFKGLTPEAIIIYPDKGLREFQVLSDDGFRLQNGVVLRNLPVAQRHFRSVWVRP